MDQPTSAPHGSQPLAPPHQAPGPASTAQLTEPMLAAIRSTGPWLRFFSILGFVCIGLMAALAALMLVGGVAGAAFSDQLGGGIMLVGMALLYVLLAVVYIFPAVFLFRAANGVVEVRRGHVVGGVEKALAAQRSFWKFVGVCTIVVICLYPVLGALLVLVPILAGSR